MKKLRIFTLALVAGLIFTGCETAQVIATYQDGCYEYKVFAPDTVKHRICPGKKDAEK